MKENLFEEFAEVSAKQWKQKIQYDLKGADYNEKLIWKSLEGINVKPFYHPDEQQYYLKAHPPASWTILEKIYVFSIEKSRKTVQHALAKGAEGIWLEIPDENQNLKPVFEPVDLEVVPLHVKTDFVSPSFAHKLNKLAEKNNKIYLQTDIVGNLARTGNWFKNMKEDFASLDEILEQTPELESAISVDMGLYQNAGANHVQQLAYALSHVNEYLNHLSDRISEEEKKKVKVQFISATGPNYFFEIAKLRALRLLFSSLASEYGFSEECFVLAQPSRRNKTLYDFNVNLLRTTTECMSAILGGTDTICNMAYDALYHKNNEFGSRIARNQLLVLKHEAHFEKVANPAEGSYYVETLTHELAEKALETFKQIESGGGFISQLKEGIIQKKIAETATKEQEAFDSGELVLIGTNKFPDPENKMENELELYPFLKKNPRKTLLQPILEKRLAENIEKERLNSEKQT